MDDFEEFCSSLVETLRSDDKDLDEERKRYASFETGLSPKFESRLLDLNLVMDKVKKGRVTLDDMEEKQMRTRTEINKTRNDIEERKLICMKLAEQNLRKTKALARLSTKDQMYMDSIEKRLKTYKTVTGIRWDFQNCDKTQISGFVVNERSKCRHFRIDITTMDKKRISNELWLHIKTVVRSEN